jgi:hypothetical protein
MSREVVKVGQGNPLSRGWRARRRAGALRNDGAGRCPRAPATATNNEECVYVLEGVLRRSMTRPAT